MRPQSGQGKGLSLRCVLRWCLRRSEERAKAFSQSAQPLGPLTRVGADVLAVVRGPGVVSGAEGARVGLLARVQAAVLLQRALVQVGFAAELAGVGLGPAVCLPVAQQVAGLLEGLPALQTLVGMLLQGGPLRTPWPNGLCAGESRCSPGDMAGAAVSRCLPRVAPQGHCGVLGATGPGGPAVHLGRVLLAQGFPASGLATQGMKADQQLQLSGHTVSIDEGEGFVEDLTFLAQQVHRHILPWVVPWTAVVVLLGFLLISIAVTLLPRWCTLAPTLLSSRLPQGYSWSRRSGYFGLAMLLTCVRHGRLSGSSTSGAIAVGDLDFGAGGDDRREEQKATRQLFLNVAGFVFGHIDLCLDLMSFFLLLMATMLI